MKDVPVYLFTGFLEGGKTRFIQETLEDQRFNNGERTLLLQCEEGIEELEPSRFPGGGRNIFIERIDSMEGLNPARLTALLKRHRAERVLLEYNGMWLISDLGEALPEDWIIYQEFMFSEASSFLTYNANMRNLMVDKLKTAELVVLNRANDELDRLAIHQAIRSVTRRAAIAYEYPEGRVEYDEIEDPLPFDIEAEVIEIEDRDYAIWYRDMSEELQKYSGKKVRFKGIVAVNNRLPADTFVAGRHVMVCCAEDIEYSGLVCKWEHAGSLSNRQWATITARIEVRFNKIYGGKGPVLHVLGLEPAEKPEQEVATFF